MRFSDGMEINTDGELRIVRKSDGLYVVGEGYLIPVDSREEGEEEIRLLESRRWNMRG